MRKTLLIALMTGGLVMGATTSIYAYEKAKNNRQITQSPAYLEYGEVINTQSKEGKPKRRDQDTLIVERAGQNEVQDTQVYGDKMPGFD